ncbi:type II secretion system protein [Candidatus Wolfebacteria bacterium]|nr:type II secretion system protein [Candidatus Wolfebacteria bacterium]
MIKKIKSTDNFIFGFTLIELLIYIGIFSIVSGLMTGILTTTLKINQRESSSGEVISQLNFVIQTIQRLTKESSAIIVNSTSTDYDNDGILGTPQTRLVLRMKDSDDSVLTNRDPIAIYISSSTIKMSEGRGAYQRISDLTNSRVLADQLQFIKYIQYPGHDTVSVDIQLSYNTQNPQAKASRNLHTAIARVSAATFDSNLLPGADNTYEIGYSGSNLRWKNISISNLLNLGQLSADPTVGVKDGSIYYNTNNKSFRGYASSTWGNLGGGLSGGQSNYLPLWNSASTQGTSTIYQSSNNIGIGTTTPAVKLSVVGDLTVSATSIFSGNVGIGTTTSSQKLSVAGTIESTSGGFKFPDGTTQTTATPNFNGALVYSSVNWTIPFGNMTYITWDSETYDTNNIHNNVTNNSRLTVPAGVTKVRLSANALFGGSANAVELKIYKNRLSFTGSPSMMIYPIAGNWHTYNIVSPAIDVTAGDYFEVAASAQTSNETMYTTYTPLYTQHEAWFAMEIIK